MEDYFRTLIEKCKFGELRAGELLEKVARTNCIAKNRFIRPRKLNQSTSNEEPTKEKPLNEQLFKEKETLTKLPSSLLTISSKTNESNSTMLTNFNTSIEEESNKPQKEKTLFEKQLELRQKLIVQQNEELDLQKFIEVQLFKLSETIGPIKDKQQLEDIKRKFRLKWLLKKKEIQRNKQRQEEEEFKANCSFKPQINESSIQPRYWDTQRKLSFEFSHPECTFTPKISKNSMMILKNSSRSKSGSFRVRDVSEDHRKDGNDTFNEYMKSDKKEVILNKYSKGKRETFINREDTFEDDWNEVTQNFCSIQPYPKEKLPNLQTEELSQPGQEENKIEKILHFDEIHDLNFGKLKPERKINTVRIKNDNHLKESSQIKEISQSLCKSKNYSMNNKANKKHETNQDQNIQKAISCNGKYLEHQGKENCVKCRKKTQEAQQKVVSKEEKNKWFQEFLKRNKEFKDQRSQRLDQMEKEIHKDCSFKPQISKAAQASEKWTYESKVNKFLQEKQEWASKKRQEKEAKELENVTHHPNITKDKDKTTSSKLYLNLPTSQYVEKLKEQEEIGQEYINMMKRRKEALESIECTYRPQINENPFYLKKDTSSMISSVRSSCTSPSYKKLHGRKVQGASSLSSVISNQTTQKNFFWNSQTKESIQIPSLFDNIDEDKLAISN